MSQLEEATQKLQSAIDRLDRAVTARAGQSETQDVEVRAALLEAKQQNARLQAVASQAGDRLDTAIGRLRTILEA